MKVLVLHRKRVDDRKTIKDHLYSFRHYVSDVDFFYCDVLSALPFFINWVKWDGIIFHYTLLAEKFSLERFRIVYNRFPKSLSHLTGYRVAIPQDEYYNTDLVMSFFKECRIQSVFTCLPPSEYNKVYPLNKTGLQHRMTTLTGFIDEKTLNKYLGPKHSERPIDIGYRARNLPFWFGRHAQLKNEIAEKFNNLSVRDLKMDISTKAKDVFYGDDWIEFIKQCRTMIGCLGGVSLLQKDNCLKEKVENYLKKYPNALFDEVEEACFPGEDGNLKLFTIGPRHFECAMAKTCQVLLEGDYQGIFQPNIHYIELKKDFSNLGEVIEKIRDVDYCEMIAETAYRDIVLSGKYTYRRFAEDVIDHIQKQGQLQPPQRIRTLVVSVLLSCHTCIRTGMLWFGKVKKALSKISWLRKIKRKLFN